jgi:hypothetical protein
MPVIIKCKKIERNDDFFILRGKNVQDGISCCKIVSIFIREENLVNNNDN